MNKPTNLLCIASLCILPNIALAQVDDYLPLTKLEVGKPFPLHKEATIESTLLSPLQVAADSDDVKIENDANVTQTLTVTGQDRSKKKWRVAVSQFFGMLPVDLYKADLDKNGLVDLVFIVPTGGNGLAPSTHLVVILFDEDGKPVPFEADGYFEPLANGIDALVDMNHDGKAELIYMNFDDGYWITNIYASKNSRWSKIKGVFTKRNYPLFTRFTQRPNRKAVKPKPERHPYAPNLANDKPVFEGHLLSFHIPDEFSDVSMTFVDAKGKHVECTPSYWYDSARVIYDTAEGRQIAHLVASDRENAEKLLNQIIKKQLKVSLYGQRYSDKCSPEITWAIEGKTNETEAVETRRVIKK